MFAGDGGNFRRTASAPIPPPSTFSVSLNLPKLSCVLLASRFLSAAPPFLVVHIFSGQRFADGSGLDEVGGGGSSLVQQLRLLCFFFLYPFLFLPVAPILSIPALSVFSFCFLFVYPKPPLLFPTLFALPHFHFSVLPVNSLAEAQLPDFPLFFFWLPTPKAQNLSFAF